MKTIKYIFRIIIDFSALIACALSVYIISRGFPRDNELHFDYQSIIVGIIAGIFTLLVGWNIYQMVDWKKKMEEFERFRDNMQIKFDDMASETTKSIDYLHNKSDYNQALTYGFLSTNAAVTITDCEKDIIKCQMLNYGLTALVGLSKYPDTKQECQSIINTLVEALEFSKEIKITSEDATYYIMQCGKIDKSDKFENFGSLISLLSKYIANI